MPFLCPFHDIEPGPLPTLEVGDRWILGVEAKERHKA